MQTSGLVLDVYDDFRGDCLRTIFASREVLPGLVKEAQVLSAEDRHRLPDDAYALVLINDGQKLRKYACTDPGNTILSVRYFEKNAHKLPLVAQLTAASNLSKACGWYGLEDLAKEAGLLGWAAQKGVQQAVAHPLDTAMKLHSGAALVQGAKQDMGARMGAIHQMEGPGQVVTPHQVSHVLGKQAELTGTNTMPLQGPSTKAVEPTKAVVNKTGSVGHLVPGKHGTEPAISPIDDDGGTGGTQPLRNAQAHGMKPHVDVTNHEPPKMLTEKKAQHYALDDQYPLDSYEQVKRAAAYFAEYGMHLSPIERREYCTNVAKRASLLDIKMSDSLQKYAGAYYASNEELKIAFDSRRSCLTDDKARAVLSLLEEKRAEVPPELFCAVLEEFDKEAGLDIHYDTHVFDPYFTTYGADKTAADDWSYIDGNTYITEADLWRLARVQANSLHKTFGKEFALEFRKDPVAIFNSLPKDQKKVIATFASDNAPGSSMSH